MSLPFDFACAAPPPTHPSAAAAAEGPGLAAPLMLFAQPAPCAVSIDAGPAAAAAAWLHSNAAHELPPAPANAYVTHAIAVKDCGPAAWQNAPAPAPLAPPALSDFHGVTHTRLAAAADAAAALMAVHGAADDLFTSWAGGGGASSGMGTNQGLAPLPLPGCGWQAGAPAAASAGAPAAPLPVLSVALLDVGRQGSWIWRPASC
jgi:hypothetical protein